jgi:hypothetical protein
MLLVAPVAGKELGQQESRLRCSQVVASSEDEEDAEKWFPAGLVRNWLDFGCGVRREDFFHDFSTKPRTAGVGLA